MPATLARLAIVPLSILAATIHAQGQQFDAASPQLPGPPEDSSSVLPVDVDGDGDLDLAFANGDAFSGGTSASPQHLFLNGGTGSFTAAHGQLNVADMPAVKVLGSDVDADGDLDLLFTSGVGLVPSALLINDGTGVFADAGEPALALSLRCLEAAFVDLDLNGLPDLVMTQASTLNGLGVPAVLLNQGGTFAASPGLLPHLVPNRDLVLLDEEDDFDLDLVFSGSGDSIRIPNQSQAFPSASPWSHGLGTVRDATFADLDGDWDEDGLLAGNLTAAAQGLAPFAHDVLALDQGLTVPLATTLLDYDDDGDLDAFSAGLQPTLAYRNDGGFQWTTQVGLVNDPGGGERRDLASGDLDCDGDRELVAAAGGGAWENLIFWNNGPKDTQKPRIRVKSTPAIQPGGTTFFIKVQDNAKDDAGHSDVEVWAGYKMRAGHVVQETVEGAEVTHVGGDLYRVKVPNDAETTSIVLKWVVEDPCGNAVAAVAFTHAPFIPQITVPVQADMRSPITGAEISDQIGEIEVSVVGPTMEAEFKLAAPYAYLDEWYDFRWVQVVIGMVQDGETLLSHPLVGTFPAIDPKEGTAIPFALPSGLTDDRPFYYNDANWVANDPAGIHAEHKHSRMHDTPSLPDHSLVIFDSHLVVRDLTASQFGAQEFCVLESFSWQYENDGTPVGGEATVLGAVDNVTPSLDKSLVNANAVGDFLGWSRVDCPNLQACLDPQLRFFDLHNGKQGSQGTPVLAGLGDLSPNSPVALTLDDGLPFGLSYLFVGFTPLWSPFKQGIMVPSPDIVLPPLRLDGTGSLVLPSTWPAGVPSGFETYWQFWMPDSAASQGVGASNGLLAVTP